MGSQLLEQAAVGGVMAAMGGAGVNAAIHWLPRALAFKTVLLGHDGDDAGDLAAAKLAPESGPLGIRRACFARS